MPLLLDPEHEFREAVGAAAPLGVRMLNPLGAASYVGSLRRGYRPRPSPATPSAARAS